MIRAYRLAFTDSLSTAFKPRGAAAGWNSEGVVTVYCSEHVALAALEILTGWEVYASLSGYYLYGCSFDEALVQVAPDGLDIHDRTEIRAFGDRWIADRRCPVLKVPSVVAPLSFNYLLNPDHPTFLKEVELEAHGRFAFDDRAESLLSEAQRK